MAGDRWWPSPQGAIDAGQVLRFVAEANHSRVVISSLHVDAEPWGLDEWPDMKEELATAFLDLVATMEDLRIEVGLGVPVSYLVPYWFDGSNGEAPRISFDGESGYPYDHLTSVIRSGGSVAIMAYRNRALGDGGIVDLVGHEIEQESPQVLIAVETAPIDPPTATFVGLDLATLRGQLQTVVDRTAVSEVVINDLESLRRLAAGSDPTKR